MDRREFVKDSLVVIGGALLPAKIALAKPIEPSRNWYMREKIPEFEIAPWRGMRYDDKIPDTLDIAERAKLGINCLTGITDPAADSEIFWSADFHRNPPVMSHDYSDWCQNVEGMMESLALLRSATGSDLNNNVDRVWTEVLLKSIGPDGLVYVSLNRAPWARLNHCWVTPVWRADGTTTDVSDKSVSQITNPNLWPRAIAAMIIYYLRDKNPMWKETIERMIQGMSTLVSDQGDYCFFPPGGFEPNARFAGGGEAGEQVMPTGFLALDGGNVRVIQGLAQYYRMTGYEPARTLAKKLVKFIRFHADAYDEEGRFLFSAYEKSDAQAFVKYSQAHGGHATLDEIKGQRLGGHFHSHTLGILAMIDYGMAVDDRELLDWCKASFEWAKTQGSSLVGFFPEFIAPGYPSCESCEVADMIGIAAKLTRAGVGDYWDDVDRWTRNQFAENQLTEGDWIYGLAESEPKKPVAYNETSDHVATRNLGGFAGWASGNEWALRSGIMHCCTGNSTRALYYIWENIVESKGEKFQVNLLLNHVSSWGDVQSFIPYRGRVVVKLKRPCQSVLIRMPEWLKSGSPEVVCKLDGSSREVTWEGRYINVGAGNSGESLEIAFPMTTRTVTERLGCTDYTLEIKGSTVVSVDPPGQKGAIYQRAHYRSDQESWRQVQRFVSNDEISW
jgi:hypothetical protein